MKTKTLLVAILSGLFLNTSFSSLSAQVPRGFNYQAIARDGSGNPIASTSIQVKLAVTADSLGATVYWEELFNPVTTNAFGLFTVVLGQGVRQATSTVPDFPSVNWTGWPLFVRTQIYYQNAWKDMGSSRLWSVPYAFNTNTVSGSQSYLNVKGNTTVMDSALFVVRNNIGQIIFAVYNEGVRIYVDDGIAKGTNKGGFAIGSFGTGKAPSQEFFRVTRDSTRVYVNPNVKGTKGGFAIGGFGAKGSDTYLNLTPNNYFIGQGSGLHVTTGLYNTFAGFESGMNNSSGSKNVFLGYNSGLLNDTASSNVFIGNETGKSNTFGNGNVFLGYRSGFSNVTGTSNVFIGFSSGYNNLGGSFNAGNYNVFIGYNTGYMNSTGNNNTYLGYEAGKNTTSAFNNVFLGASAGYFTTNGHNNIFLGASSGHENTTGQFNIYMGSDAGYKNTSGSGNIFLGDESGSNNTTGSENIFMGTWSGGYSSAASNNICLGRQTGFMVTGTDNIFVGPMAGMYTTSGTSNLFCGSLAGYTNQTGSGNIFLGYKAGYSETGSNKLYISNTDANPPLIYGDFSSKKIGLGTISPAANVEVYVTGTDGYAGIGINKAGGKLITLNQGIAGVLNFTVPGLVDLVTLDFNLNRMGINNVAPQYPFQVGTTTTNGNGAFLTAGGVWSNASSRTFKDRFTTIDGVELIGKIEELDVASWYYRNTEEYHIGPVAEDFYDLFGTGDKRSSEVRKYLSSSDVAGVSLAAVKELIRQNKEQKAYIEKQQTEINALKEEIDKIKALIPGAYSK